MCGADGGTTEPAKLGALANEGNPDGVMIGNGGLGAAACLRGLRNSNELGS